MASGSQRAEDHSAEYSSCHISLLEWILAPTPARWGTFSKLFTISVSSIVQWEQELNTYLLEIWEGLNELVQEKCLKYCLALYA